MQGNIQAFIETQKDRRGFRPEKTPSDLSGMARVASTSSKYRPAYKPRHATKAKLKLKEAYCYISEQNAWDDSVEYAVACEVENGANLEHLAVNLGLFAQAARSTNGFAGFGSSYDITYIPEYKVVKIRVRSSIAD